MIVAGRLFVVLGLFGMVAGLIYYTANSDPELAGVGLLGTFFASCLFIGIVLLRHSPASKRFAGLPDTGLAGSAHPERGAADEHGHIHHMAPTLAPLWYSLAGVILLGGVVFRDRLLGPWGIGLGALVFLLGTAVWYRNVSADARAAVAADAGGTAVLEHHVAEVEVEEEPPGPPGPDNWFEQVRLAAEAGDADWAAGAYDLDAVYYEPANPPHQGRESVRAYLNSFLRGHQDLIWEVDRIGTDGDVAIVEWRWSFKARDGRRISDQRGMTVIETGPAGITYHRDYF